MAPVGGQPVGQDATGRARADDDVVEGVRHDATPARFAQRPELRVRMPHAGAPGGRNPAHLLGATAYAVGVLSGLATADHLAPLADAVVPNIHALNIVGV